MRKYGFILRLILATTIVLGMVPAQAIQSACAQPKKTSCHSESNSCCGVQKSCGCEISSQKNPEAKAVLAPAPQLIVIAIVGEPIPNLSPLSSTADPKIPEQKAHAPPGTPPRESASRAPPVNL